MSKKLQHFPLLIALSLTHSKHVLRFSIFFHGKFDFLVKFSFGDTKFSKTTQKMDRKTIFPTKLPVQFTAKHRSFTQQLLLNILQTPDLSICPESSFCKSAHGAACIARETQILSLSSLQTNLSGANTTIGDAYSHMKLIVDQREFRLPFN